MDYRFNDLEKFNLLLKQTEKFRAKYFEKSHSVRSNIYEIYDSIGCNPFDGHVTHIFALFASGSLFNSYLKYFIAADYRIDQQYAVHPYGSNSTTNSHMRNAYGQLITRDDDVTRSFKAKYLMDNNANLDSLSICTNYSVRPKNCGICGKCIRTKVMFYAGTGSVPNIFNEHKIPNDWYKSINVNNKIQRVFMGDILDSISVSKSSEQLNYEDAYKYWHQAAVDGRLGKLLKLKQGFKALKKQLKNNWGANKKLS